MLQEDHPKVKNVDSTREVNELLNFLITILNIKCNSKEEEEELDMQMILILDLIKTKFGNLTIPEIQEAFKMYVTKSFPEIKVFRILDCIVVGDILSAYIEFRNESLRIYSEKKKSLLTAPKIASDEEKKQIRIDLLKIIFDEVQKEGVSSEGFFIYDELYGAGLIKITDLDKKILYRQELEKYLNNQKSKISLENRKKELANLKENINEKKSVDAVANICKNILVGQFVKKNIATIDDFIKVFFP